jgi:DNA repair photolyase
VAIDPGRLQALDVLDEPELPFRLVTKGTTVVRDADLLTRPGSLIQVSLTRCSTT